jgi:hypothetical protein
MVDCDSEGRMETNIRTTLLNDEHNGTYNGP